MFTRKRFTLPQLTGDWKADGHRLVKAISDYWLSLEQPNSLTIDEADIHGESITRGLVPTARLGSGTADATTYLRGDQTWTTPSWTTGSVTFANTDRLLGRDTAGGGAGEELTASGGIEFTGTGIQTSAFTGDVTKAAGGTALAIGANKVTYAMLQQASAGYTILAKAGTGAGNYAELAAADETVLGRTSAGNVAFAQVATGQIAIKAVTYAKIQDSLVGFTVLGREVTGTGGFAEIVAGTDSVLGRSGSGNLIFAQVATGQVANNAITYAKMQQASAGYTVMAKVGTGAGNYAELAAGSDSVLGRSGSADVAFITLLPNSLVNWGSPSAIGTGTPAAGTFTAIAAGSGANTATYAIHAQNAADAATIIASVCSGTGTAAQGHFRAEANSSIASLIAHGSGRTVVRYGITLGGWNELYNANNSGTNNGLIIGTQTNVPIVLGINNVEVARLTSTGLGVGVTPAARLDVAGANVAVGQNNSFAQLRTTTAQAVDVGAALQFGGMYDGSNSLGFAEISGRKENSVSGEWGGYFQIATRQYGGSFAERMRVTSSGLVGIGRTPSTYKLEVEGGAIGKGGALGHHVDAYASVSAAIAAALAGTNGSNTVVFGAGTYTISSTITIELTSTDSTINIVGNGSDGTDATILAVADNQIGLHFKPMLLYMRTGITIRDLQLKGDGSATGTTGIKIGNDSVAVTFTDAGDTVNLTAHGLSNGTPVQFSSITTTTGISVDTTYYAVGVAANTFQVEATVGGGALALTNNGSGVMTAQIDNLSQAVIENVNVYNCNTGVHFINTRKVAMRSVALRGVETNDSFALKVIGTRAGYSDGLVFHDVEFSTYTDDPASGEKAVLCEASYAGGVSALHFTDCWFYYGEHSCVHLNNTSTGGIGQVHFTRCQFDNSSYVDSEGAIYISNTNASGSVVDVAIDGCWFEGWLKCVYWNPNSSSTNRNLRFTNNIVNNSTSSSGCVCDVFYVDELVLSNNSLYHCGNGTTTGTNGAFYLNNCNNYAVNGNTHMANGATSNLGWMLVGQTTTNGTCAGNYIHYKAGGGATAYAAGTNNNDSGNYGNT